MIRPRINAIAQPQEESVSLVDLIKETVFEAVRNSILEFLTDSWAIVRADLIEAGHVVTLVGGTICIVLYVSGWEKGMKNAGILFVGYLLLRAILG